MVEALYKCAKCGKEFKMDLAITREIRCPYCGAKIIYKPRPKVARRIKAI
ncbi:DNA-directed RNA polymerase subunit P [Thermococcus litoralis DSM 5473]|jgi:DNA-directed RNA polymerase subunit P|uniref:DNA-directed RNA polymerase subunit Rpo12 n=1 Tax=Thermococcus litoralis (strain ATCC 51850 / DSM 5473 / JCM 8560 / NS-C) TaxID=523849 RepID=H3ZKB1_THELN|nr:MULTISPECIES: DNA-directed RNA polymerase subunit P [Thermococcus]ALV63101.1 DNA-directed RNA polymerase subunit P [Thermococcus sp. 2319x1]EHR79664.1 DNA-directed RNA polymerase subunit P [Thermococcus litoralis DSM 5473]MCO6041560.1 DNA-directed RNA polymerase subunit P [Thermococcus alcaliphilus]